MSTAADWKNRGDPQGGYLVLTPAEADLPKPTFRRLPAPGFRCPQWPGTDFCVWPNCDCEVTK